MRRRKDDNPFWTCDIRPFVDELMARFEQARKSNLTVLNLSYTHPNGFFPVAIMRREPLLGILKDAVKQGWSIDISIGPVEPYPDNIWLPKGMRRGKIDFSICDLTPFLKELDRREEEAKLDAQAMSFRKKKTIVPIVDLTSHNKDGTFPSEIWVRIKRRSSPSWIKETQAQIEKLEGQANKDEAFAKTQSERMEAVDNPARLKASADELLARAASLRAQAKFLRKELTGI